MERDWQGPGEFYQLAGSWDVYTTVGVEESDYDSVRPQGFGRGDVVTHDFEFIVAVAEISSAGANHHLQTEGSFFADSFDESGAGSGSAFQKIATEFYALRAAALGGQGRVYGVDADFYSD